MVNFDWIGMSFDWEWDIIVIFHGLGFKKKAYSTDGHEENYADSREMVECG